MSAPESRWIAGADVSALYLNKVIHDMQAFTYLFTLSSASCSLLKSKRERRSQSAEVRGRVNMRDTTHYLHTFYDTHICKL